MRKFVAVQKSLSSNVLSGSEDSAMRLLRHDKNLLRLRITRLVAGFESGDVDVSAIVRTENEARFSRHRLSDREFRGATRAGRR